MSKHREYIFTFGYGQGHDGCFVVIRESNKEDARRIMIHHYDLKWYKVYRSREAAGVYDYNLKEIALKGEPV